jgi:photosystem II stability/assembly factor-like uncharacterized protein
MTPLRSLVVAAGLAAVAGSTLVPVAATPALVPASVANDDVRWVDVGTGTDEQYRALDAVKRRVAWVAGEDGGILHTRNGGRTWRDLSPRRFSDFTFRDIEATGPGRASVLAIGPGTDSRIFTTRNGGRLWTTAFVNREPAAFYNCMDFWAGGRRGLAVSDPVDGKFRILRTTDAGMSWSVVPPRGMPAAVEGEFNFAASGTCLVTMGKSRAYMVSGGAASRVFRSPDGGRTWLVTDAPLPPSDAGGVFSVAFRSLRRGVVVGGDFTAPEARPVTGITRSFGRAWTRTGRTHGYRSGVTFRPGHPRVVIAVGPTGTDLSRDGGRTWTLVDRTAFDGVECTVAGACWASGPDGGVGRLRWR